MKAIFSDSIPPAERLAYGLSLLLILGQFGLIAGYYFQLPDVVPVHFGTGGKPDRWGSRAQLFIAPLLSGFMFLLFWGIGQIPADFYNMPNPVTPEKRERILRNSREMLAMLLLITMIFMFWTLWNWLEAARTHSVIEKTAPIFTFITAMIGVPGFYLWRMYRRP